MQFTRIGHNLMIGFNVCSLLNDDFERPLGGLISRSLSRVSPRRLFVALKLGKKRSRSVG